MYTDLGGIREYGSTLYVGMAGTEKKWPPIHFNCK